MTALFHLQPLDRDGLALAQNAVANRHYLHKPVDRRCRPEGYSIQVTGYPGDAGYLLFGRPQATKCYPWYGSVDDVATGRAEVTRWQVLNLARVWIHPALQPNPFGNPNPHFGPRRVPGYVDRKGVFRSTLASDAIKAALASIGVDYLVRQPVCFPEEPYDILYVLSYCDPRIHRGTIYRAAGFELYRANAEGLQTWRIPIPSLTTAQRLQVLAASQHDPRAIRYRAQRAQVPLFQLG